MSTSLLIAYDMSCPLCVRFHSWPEILNRLSADLLLYRRSFRALAWEYRPFPEAGVRLVTFAELKCHRAHVGCDGLPEDYFFTPECYEDGDPRRRNVQRIDVLIQSATDRESKRRALYVADRMYCFAWVHFALSLGSDGSLSETCVRQIVAESLFDRALGVAREAGVAAEARRLGFEKFPALRNEPPRRSRRTRAHENTVGL